MKGIATEYNGFKPIPDEEGTEMVLAETARSLLDKGPQRTVEIAPTSFLSAPGQISRPHRLHRCTSNLLPLSRLAARGESL